MSTFRVRFKLNPGRSGIALGKLSKQTENIEMFLRSLAADLGEGGGQEIWLAKDFKNGSVYNTNELQAVIDADKCAKFDAATESLAKFRISTKTPSVPSFVSPATIGRFAALRQGMDADELIGISTFRPDGRPKPWVYVDRLRFDLVADSIERELVYVGSVMGTTYEWIKGAKEPYLTIRELNTGELIRCIYRDRDYSRVAKLFELKTAVVIVSGTARYDRVTGKTQILEATDFELAPEFSDRDFEAFFGCAPNMTGEQSSEDFIRKGRDDEN